MLWHSHDSGSFAARRSDCRQSWPCHRRRDDQITEQAWEASSRQQTLALWPRWPSCLPRAGSASAIFRPSAARCHKARACIGGRPRFVIVGTNRGFRRCQHAHGGRRKHAQSDRACAWSLRGPRLGEGARVTTRAAPRLAAPGGEVVGHRRPTTCTALALSVDGVALALHAGAIGLREIGSVLVLR